MTSYMPPSDRIWWKTPVGKEELLWIGIALIWCLIMFFMMPYWHIYGKQNLSNEAYQTNAVQFQSKVDAMVDQYQVREESGFSGGQAARGIRRLHAGKVVAVVSHP